MKFTLSLCGLLVGLAAQAQTAENAAALPGAVGEAPGTVPLKYGTSFGHISFFSSTPIEDIESQNQRVGAVVDLVTGTMAFSAPMRAFHFKRQLMEEHFHEDYAESDKYPKATFSGKLLALPPGAKLKKAPQPVEVQGILTIHGVNRKVRVPGTLEIRDGQLLVTSSFMLAPADYKIEIPVLVRQTIAESIDVKVQLVYTMLP